MAATEHLIIDLPADLASTVRAKVASGEYSSESDVVREALALFRDRDRSLDEWLRTEVLDSYRDWQAHPETAIPLEDFQNALLR